ncbi:MAG: ABC transporter substrate-binding protein, partial [bacterium]
MVVIKRVLLACTLLFAAVGVVMASGEGEADAAAGGSAEGTRQSPALQQLVDSDELPPLEERLPVEPLVVEPVDSIGQYGDEISFISRVGASATTRRTVSYQHLVKWDREFSKWIPNVAKDVIISDDASSFIFELREGMRWSDGELFTADDIVFWYNELMLNEDLFSSVPDYLRIGDEPATVTKVDDLAVEFRFSESNGFFLQNVASVGGYGPTSAPEHHFRQFMPEYNENADELAEERGYESAADMVGAMLEFTTMFDFVDIPRLDPWIYTTPLTEPTSRLVAERNPYFWKVDTEGNQLPYIDTFVTIQNDDRESLLLQALNGEVDYVHSYITNATNRPVIAQNRDRGDYDFVDVIATDSNAMAIALNLTHQDPVLREVFQNKDFRIALSHAIDRD